MARLFDETTTIFVNRDRWVVWNLIQLGGAPHPMHIHMARFQLLSRWKFADLTAFDLAAGGTTRPMLAPVAGSPIEKHEEGWKETFSLWAGEWIRVAGQFDGATGQFMYHCHILDHDEGMMRPFVVHPPEVARFHMHPGGAGHHAGSPDHGGHR
ncbi:MAG: multicopper oxidase domain-containing protein [Actinophytocola sp.]|uniref:multicopper oxidase domain-containing protein n=1 Tax=Actinophytocola sp. TaxID=1872138 RepID=UPI003C712BC6